MEREAKREHSLRFGGEEELERSREIRRLTLELSRGRISNTYLMFVRICNDDDSSYDNNNEYI